MSLMLPMLLRRCQIATVCDSRGLQLQQLKLCKQYLSAISERDMEQILSLFQPGALVSSPLSGTTDVEAFHRRLFQDIDRSIPRIKHIFATVNDLSAVALHFSHTWILKNGEVVEFDGINIFEVTEDGSRFSKLTIMYDSAPLRP